VLEPEQASASSAATAADEQQEHVLELLPALRDAQHRNLSRAARLQELIEDEKASLPEPGGLAGGPAEQAEAAAQARDQLQLAEQILLVTEASMQGVVAELGEPPAAAGAAASWRGAIVPGRQAVKGLENLRRLFFSIIEHLRDTARRQQQLGDETERAAALPEEDRERGLGPLKPKQAELAEVAGVIANTLEEQSRHEPGDLVGGGGGAAGGPDPDAGADAQTLAEEAIKLRRAAELSLEAQIEMEDTGVNLEVAPADFAKAREHQDQAHARLLEAIELLTPPQEQQQDQQQDQQQEQQEQQEQQQEEQQEQQAGEQPQEQPRDEQESDPSQLLQEVRDREAERRRENAKRNQRGFDTVEQDW